MGWSPKRPGHLSDSPGVVVLCSGSPDSVILFKEILVVAYFVYSVNASTKSFTAWSASRCASGDRLKRNSINFRIDTVSYCLWSMKPGRANGDTMIAGTRTPVPKPSVRTGGGT